MEKSIDLKLSVNEINQVINALAAQPYVQVFTLIEKIQNVTKESFNEDTKESTDAF